MRWIWWWIFVRNAVKSGELFFFTAFTAITAFLTKIHRIHRISYENLPKNLDPGCMDWYMVRICFQERSTRVLKRISVATVLTRESNRSDVNYTYTGGVGGGGCNLGKHKELPALIWSRSASKMKRSGCSKHTKESVPIGNNDVSTQKISDIHKTFPGWPHFKNLKNVGSRYYGTV